MRDRRLDLADPPAALSLDRRLQIGTPARQLVQPDPLRFELLLPLCLIEFELLDLLFEQHGTMPGEPRGKRLPGAPQRCEVSLQCFEALSVGRQRRQALDLVARPHYCIMRVVQVLEVADERPDPILRVVRFEHVPTHELGEIPHRLHRHGLVEEIERLRVRHAQFAPQPRAVLLEGVEEGDAPISPQPLAQALDVFAKAREVFRDRERAGRDDVEAVRVALALLGPEDLGQRNVALGNPVGEHAKEHAVTALPA